MTINIKCRFSTILPGRKFDEIPRLAIDGYRLIDSVSQWPTLHIGDGVYNFAKLREFIDQFPEGTSFIYCLAGTPQWLSSQPNLITDIQSNKLQGYCAPPKNLKQLEAFVVALLNAFPEIIAIEGRNEPASRKHYVGTPEDLAGEQHAIYKAAKSVGRLVVVGSSAENYSTHVPSDLPDETVSRNEWMREYYRLANQYFDVMCFHCYPHNFSLWDRAIGWFRQTAYDESFEDKPLWCTEIGFSTWEKHAGAWNESMKAMFVALAYLYNESAGIDVTVTHNLNAGMNAIVGPELSAMSDLVRGAFNRIPQ